MHQLCRGDIDNDKLEIIGNLESNCEVELHIWFTKGKAPVALSQRRAPQILFRISTSLSLIGR